MDSKSKLTVMIVPSETGEIRRFEVRRDRVKLVLAGFAALVLCVLAVIYVLGRDYRLRHQTEAANARLVQEKDGLEARLAEYQQEIIALGERSESMTADIRQVQEFVHKLRIITNSDGTAMGPEDFAGVGGALEAQAKFEEYQPFEEDFYSLSARQTLAQNAALTFNVGRLLDNMSDFEEAFKDKHSLLVSTPSIWPVQGWVTAEYGRRLNPFTGLSEQHAGLDIAARPGTPIIAPADGVVAFSGTQGAYGLAVRVDHGFGIETVYGHMSRTDIKTGDEIQRGDILGFVGNSGRSTGPHLHYEVRLSGVPQNPRKYILN